MSPERSDADLFRRLFDAHLADLWRFARRRCHSSADADDITAQVFAVAWRRRSELPDSEVRLWLFGVARHVVANHRRSTDRQRRLQLRLIENHHADQHSNDPGSSHDELHEALASLSDDDRDVVVMRCWDGLAVNDIATLIGCTPNAVSVRLHKARRKLIDRLTEPTDRVGGGHVTVDPRPRTEERHGHQ